MCRSSRGWFRGYSKCEKLKIQKLWNSGKLISVHAVEGGIKVKSCGMHILPNFTFEGTVIEQVARKKKLSKMKMKFFNHITVLSNIKLGKMCILQHTVTFNFHTTSYRIYLHLSVFHYFKLFWFLIFNFFQFLNLDNTVTLKPVPYQTYQIRRVSYPSRTYTHRQPLVQIAVGQFIVHSVPLLAN